MGADVFRGKRRLSLLIGILIVTFVAALWPQDELVVEVAPPLAQRTSGKQLATEVAVASTGSGSGPETEPVARKSSLTEHADVDPFAIKNWTSVISQIAATQIAPEPSTVSVAAQPVAIPVQESLPFVYVGRFQDGPLDVAFITRGDRTLEIRSGEVVDGMYKIVTIESRYIEFEQISTGRRSRLSIPE